MKDKDYYSLREIVLGLRDEYLKYYQKIEELKSLCDVDWKKVVDFDIGTIQHYSGRKEGNLPELSCCYEKRLNQIQLLLRKIGSRVLGYPYEKKKVGRLVSDEDSYHIESCYKNFPIWISGEKEGEEFFEKANSILESEFANNIDMHSWYNRCLADKGGILLPKNIPGEFRYGTISAYSSWFEISMQMSDSELKTFRLYYNPSTDSLDFNMFGANGKYRVNEEAIDDILAIEYPVRQLRQYHRDIINSYDRANKDVVIDCPESKQEVELSIEENEKQYVLCKSK